MISKPIHAFYNGYDAEACETLVPSSSEAITVGYFGSFYGPIDPGPLVRAVAGSGAQLLHAGADYDRQLQQAAQKKRSSSFVTRHAFTGREFQEDADNTDSRDGASR